MLILKLKWSQEAEKQEVEAEKPKVRAETMPNLIVGDFSALYPFILTQEMLQQMRHREAAEKTETRYRDGFEKLYEDLDRRSPSMPELVFDFDALYPSIIAQKLKEQSGSTLPKPQELAEEVRVETRNAINKMMKETVDKQDDDIDAVGPNVTVSKADITKTAVPKEPIKDQREIDRDKRRAERLEENLDYAARFIYQQHASRQFKKSKRNATFQEISEVRKAARERWDTLSPASKQMYLNLAKEDRKQRDDRKQLLTDIPCK